MKTTATINRQSTGISRISKKDALDKAIGKQRVKTISSQKDVDKLFEVFPEDNTDDLLDFTMKNRHERRKAVKS